MLIEHSRWWEIFVFQRRSRPEVERLRDWVGGTGAALVPKVELLAHEAPAREPITAFLNYVSAV